jgi:aryl-alcohol dehydrogenase-like predicted oxidoreductase
MVKKRLGTSDMEITPMGVGAWAMGGGGWQFSWGPQDDDESIAAIHAALDAGVNWIDTAAIYGLGHSEEVVARALEGLVHKPYVFTKCQRVWNERREISGSLKADSVRRECEASLRRLKVETRMSKKDGRRSPSCAKRAKCGGSGCPTSTLRRSSGAGESRR